MIPIEDNISVLVQNHFPEFYKEEGDTFIAFVKAYYEWTQQTNNNIYFSRNLPELRDIDTTIDDFLVHFKEKYLVEAPVFYDTTRFNVKNSLDFYRSKGTERGTKLLFQEVWNLSDVDVYFPNRDVLRASDGQWYIPRYIEVSIAEKTNTFIGKQITGSFSGATAFVEGVSRKSITGKYLDVIYLTNIKGNFVFNEIVTFDGDLSGCPKIIGSMTSVEINDAGRNFSVGDVLDVVSARTGKQGKVRVNSVEDSTGKVTFTLEDGGTGYRITTQPVVAEKMLQISNVSSSCTYISTFLIDETVVQPLANVSIYSSNAFFSIGSLFVGANSTTNVASGRVVGTTQSQISGTLTANSTSNVVTGTNTSFSAQLDTGDYIRFQSCTSIFQVSSVTNSTSLILTTNGPNVIANSATMANADVLVIVTSGNFNLADRIPNSTALISSYQNRTATGKVMGVNTEFLGLTSVSNTFTANGFNFLYGMTSNVYANVVLVGTGSGANISVGSLTDEETVYLNTDLLSDNNSITTTILTGTVSSNTTSPQVNGVSTSFTTELYDGAYVKFSGNTLTFQVNAISNDTILTLTTNGPGTSANTLSITNGEFLTTPLDVLKYGFPKQPTANLSTILNLALTIGSYDIGTIASLTSINPGTGYNISPFVLVRDQELAAFNRRNLSVGISNITGVFVAGEGLTQDFSSPAYTLQTSGSNIGFTATETVTQQINATANVYGSSVSSNTTLSIINTSGAFINSSISSALTGTVTANATSNLVTGVGTLFTTELSTGDFVKFSGNSLIFKVSTIANSTSLTLTKNAVPVTANQIFEVSNVVLGMTSGITMFVNNAIQNNQISISRGEIVAVNPTSLSVKRKTFNQTFTPGVQITGSTSGATADVNSVTQIDGSSLMGNNALVDTFAGIVTGSLASVSIVDSGFAYENGEEVTLSSDTSNFVATGYANLINQGFGEGSFKSTRGFLNSDKYIHDGDFYQAYSYQVKAGVPLNVYGDTLKKLCHLAGTKLFGNVVKTSNVEVKITTSGVQIET